MAITVVDIVAGYEQASPDELPPLSTEVDAETLRHLVVPDGERSEPITFEYLWYDVTVLPDGDVVVTP